MKILRAIERFRNIMFWVVTIAFVLFVLTISVPKANYTGTIVSKKTESRIFDGRIQVIKLKTSAGVKTLEDTGNAVVGKYKRIHLPAPSAKVYRVTVVGIGLFNYRNVTKIHPIK